MDFINSRFYLFIASLSLLSFSIPTHSAVKLNGIYTTVSEASCNSEIHFHQDGKGLFVDTCRRPDGTLTGKVHKHNITWKQEKDKLWIDINGLTEQFNIHTDLPCHYFGDSGVSHGLVGFDMYFWKKPVTCHENKNES